ncbi:MAG: hypothetical protein KDA28_16610 [Phycisphaerales bacterium]|nr:hypothetical protein [Phycisphaerales bacterium]
MGPPDHLARRLLLRRLVAIGTFWIVQGALGWVLAVFWIVSSMSDDPVGAIRLEEVRATLVSPEALRWWATWYPVYLLAQALFMLPMLGPVPIRQKGPPAILSLAVAGFAMGGLLAALLFAVLGAVMALGRDLETDHFWIVFWSFIGAGWILSTSLLLSFSRNRSRDVVTSRLASTLFLGSLVEIAAILPLDVMVRRRTDCYCGTGTYVSLSILGVVGGFALGPMLYAIPLARRRRRWLECRCEVCGYDMRDTPQASRCPECGSGWLR